MSSNPYADVGKPVDGSRFIGRENEIRKIQARIFGRSSFGSVAIVGMPRVGKSSLIGEVVRRFTPQEAGYIVCRLDVGTFSSMEDLVAALLKEVIALVRARGLDTDLFNERAHRAIIHNREIDFHEVHGVFKAIPRDRVRVICVLDEFDAGRRIFRGSPWFFNWLRALCSDSDLNTAVVLIAKRRLQTVARIAGYDSSYWSNVLLPTTLRPFGLSEVSTFFSRLAQNGVVFDLGQRRCIESYLGSHPFLLDRLAFDAWEHHVAGDKVLETEWLELTCSRISRDYFDQLVSVLDDYPLFPRNLGQIQVAGDRVSRGDIDIVEEYGLLERHPKAGLQFFCPAFASYLKTQSVGNHSDEIGSGNTESSQFASSRYRNTNPGEPPPMLQLDPVPSFSWLHISDIHFGYPRIENQLDLEYVISALVDDAKKMVGTGRAPRPNAVFLTGDVAFSGGGSGGCDQYARAMQWLEKLSRELGLSTRDIFVVPGNHDVYRDADLDRDIARMVDALRDNMQIGETLDRALAHEGDREKLKLRQSRYLDFAKELAFGCGELWWMHEFSGGGDLAVIVAGINTAILSRDDKDQGRLQVGQQQINETLLPSSRRDDALVIVLSHHPFADHWLADQVDTVARVRRNAHIHLCGHVHGAESETSWSGAGKDFLRVVAGAVHDDSTPSHGYNFGAAYVENEGRIRIQVWPRKWSNRNSDFRTDQEVVPDAPESRGYAQHYVTLKR